METGLRYSGLRLLAATLAIVTLALAGLWFLKAGRSGRHIPEGAYLVQAQLAPGRCAMTATAPHSGASSGGN